MIDPGPWGDLALVEPVAGGHRNEVWLGSLDGDRVAVRRSRRPAPSLSWELDLLDELAAAGFAVPLVAPADDGRRTVDGVVVQRWIDGRAPSSEADWHLVADELRRLHRTTAGHAQRPGCATTPELATARRSVDADLDALPADVAERLVAVFAEVAAVETAVIHGDPGADNIRIRSDGTVGLLDWDESRVDVVWHDLSNLGVRVLDGPDHEQAERLSNAWEAVNAWTAEPTYARRRLASLDTSR